MEKSKGKKMVKKVMLKFEKSGLDKKLDKKLGLKEGSKKDKKIDKKVAMAKNPKAMAKKVLKVAKKK